MLLLTSCAATSTGGVCDELLDKARVRGSVQVIVTLRVPAGASAATIQSVKDEVLAAIAGTRYQLLHALPTLPQLAIDASEETLRALGASRNVLRIDESRPHRPQR